MVLVAEESLIALLCPSCVDILAAFLVGVVAPKAGATTLFGDGVLLPGVARPGSRHEASVFHLTLVDNKPQRRLLRPFI